jgi:exodeoxyribonuclease VII small subunit
MSTNQKNMNELGPVSEKMTFEAALEKLQVSVKKLESGELSLEDSLKLFEEGIRLTRACQEHLQAAEQRVELLMKAQSSTGQPQFQPLT